MGHGPVGPGEAVEHPFASILRRRRVEVAGGEGMVAVRQGLPQFRQVLPRGDPHRRRVEWRREVDAEAGQDAAAGQGEVGLQHAPRIADPVREVGHLERVQDGLAGEWQPAQESDVDATQVGPLDEGCGQVAEVAEVFHAQAFQDREVFDFLQRDDVGAAATVDLPDRLGQYAQLVLENVIVPVEIQALVAPAIDADRVTGLDVRSILLGRQRQVGLVVLARVVDVVGQVPVVVRRSPAADRSPRAAVASCDSRR